MSIYLYSDGSSLSIDIRKISEFLNSFSLRNRYGGNIFDFLCMDSQETEKYRQFLTFCRIYDIEIPLDGLFNSLISTDKTQTGIREERILYDGLWLQRRLHSLINTKIRYDKDDLHLIYTDKLILTYGERRYHARVVLNGSPSFISITGLIEGPAKPREYYWMKADYIQKNKDIKELEDFFEDRYISYEDSRITPTICSYSLQPIFYHYLGQGFCENNSCSLYNTHWQEELLQVHSKNLICDKCLEKINLISVKLEEDGM